MVTTISHCSLYSKRKCECVSLRLHLCLSDRSHATSVVDTREKDTRGEHAEIARLMMGRFTRRDSLRDCSPKCAVGRFEIRRGLQENPCTPQPTASSFFVVAFFLRRFWLLLLLLPLLQMCVVEYKFSCNFHSAPWTPLWPKYLSIWPFWSNFA